MKLTRRQTLGLLAGAGAGAAVVQGCSLGDSRVATPAAATDPDARFLARAGFGHRPGDLEVLKKSGREAWLEDQLAPTDDEPLELTLRLARLETTSLQAWELRDWPKEDIVRQCQQTDLLYAVLSPWQVRERMVDFWTNHFNIYGNKGLAAYRIPTDQREVVRKNAVGSFYQMLQASAKSTAMLLYLDQQASHYGQPNENYARELLELHTLGVNGGYTQKDVMEVARCFTGWTEERGFLRAKGSFRFDEALHDTGAKRVLGHTVPAGGGVGDGEKVLEIVVRHPSTARHIARKLCEYFLGSRESRVTSDESEVESRKSQAASDGSKVESRKSQAASDGSKVESRKSQVTSHESRVTSPESKVTSPESKVESRTSGTLTPDPSPPEGRGGIEERVAAAYMEEPVGDIRRMLRAIFLSDEFLEGAPTFKRPFDFVASSLRALDASTDGNRPVLRHLELMGQPTHMWPMPDGYPMAAEAWNGSVLGRWNFAFGLCSGEIQGTSVDPRRLAERYGTKGRDAWIGAVFGLSTGSPRLDQLREALGGKDPRTKQEWAELTALCLCSPEFQWR